MENYLTLKTDFKGQIATLWLARPEVHNALNEVMIREITSFFLEIEHIKEIRIVVIRGLGNSFCSGADLAWMKKSFTLDKNENLRESKELSDMFGHIFNCPKVIISAIHGNVFGGGNGIIAASDLAYCVSNSRFSLSETRIGMAAASITPYLLQKINASSLKELIFTARIFNGDEAVKLLLVNQAFNSVEEMDAYIEMQLHSILLNGTQAIVESKKLINRLTEIGVSEKELDIPKILADIRVSEEAQEGFTAFLEKRIPRWQN